MFGKVLIANRGEIALRIIRACRSLGLQTVAVYSEADAGAPHVRAADEAHLIGPAPARDSYLAIDRLLDVARRSGADAVHPGYGFLSENWRFAEACREVGLVFIGPPPEVIRMMGDKTEARRLAVGAAVPVLPGSDGPVESAVAARAVAERIGYPVMLKAAAGGGGIGMSLVGEPGQMEGAFASARRRVGSAFGDTGLYVECALQSPRHVEVQVFGDTEGRLVHIFERDCSIQRRHQKLVEESPAPVLGDGLRDKLRVAGLRVAAAARYVNAGTVEFLVSGDAFYFLEMNTRLQVEHPVTEEVAGVDLVQAQLQIAGGASLPWRQEQLRCRGAAIECRVYAEDPDRGFLPSPGRLTRVEMPVGPGLRHECGVETGSAVTVHYDPLLAKLIAWGADRGEALGRLAEAVGRCHVEGVHTTLPLHRRILGSGAFRAGGVGTDFLERGI